MLGAHDLARHPEPLRLEIAGEVLQPDLGPARGETVVQPQLVFRRRREEEVAGLTGRQHVQRDGGVVGPRSAAGRRNRAQGRHGGEREDAPHRVEPTTAA